MHSPECHLTLSLPFMILFSIMKLQQGPWNGIGLLFSVADADLMQTLVALAIAPIENKEHYAWAFSNLLKHDALSGTLLADGWALISDRDKGIVPAAEEKLGVLHHYWCVKHLQRNIPALGADGKDGNTYGPREVLFPAMDGTFSFGTVWSKP